LQLDGRHDGRASHFGDGLSHGIEPSFDVFESPLDPKHFFVAVEEFDPAKEVLEVFRVLRGEHVYAVRGHFFQEKEGLIDH
jgi:hypothetical protein